MICDYCGDIAAKTEISYLKIHKSEHDEVLKIIKEHFKKRIPPVSDRWLEPKQWTLADFVCKSDDSCRRSLTGGT